VALRVTVVVLELFVGIGGIFGGLERIRHPLDPLGMSTELIAGSPFDTWPQVLLLVLVGVTPCVLAVGVIAGTRGALALSWMFGIGLMAWIGVQWPGSEFSGCCSRIVCGSSRSYSVSALSSPLSRQRAERPQVPNERQRLAEPGSVGHGLGRGDGLVLGRGEGSRSLNHEDHRNGQQKGQKPDHCQLTGSDTDSTHGNLRGQDRAVPGHGLVWRWRLRRCRPLSRTTGAVKLGPLTTGAMTTCAAVRTAESSGKGTP